MPSNYQRFRNSRQAQRPALFKDNTTGFSGWRVTLEPQRAVPTPAVARGRIFVGGGFGSYDFYAFDARTGAQVWHLGTTDDGPTAAVLADGLVVFNTESCTLEVVEAFSGKLVWEKWLGDPLLAQPAVMDGRVSMVYPRDGRIISWNSLTGEVRWAVNVGAPCHWQPVVSDGWVYAGLENGNLVGFATGDSLDSDWSMWGGGCAHNGKPIHEARPATEAPPGPTPEDIDKQDVADLESVPAAPTG